MSISELKKRLAEAKRVAARAVKATEAAGLKRLSDDEKSLAGDKELMWNIYG